MPNKTLTHKDLAQSIGVSETTIKSYRRKFPNCIPIASSGKPIRFTEEALVVCQKIKELFELGMCIKEVYNRLASEFTWINPNFFDNNEFTDKEQVENIYKNTTNNKNTEISVASFNNKSVTKTAIKTNTNPDQTEFINNNSANGELTDLNLATEALKKDFNTAGVYQPFAKALSGLAKSVITLAQQQNNVIKRLEFLENDFAKQKENKDNYKNETELKITGNNAAANQDNIQMINPDITNDIKIKNAELNEKLSEMNNNLLKTMQLLENYVETPASTFPKPNSENNINKISVVSKIIESNQENKQQQNKTAQVNSDLLPKNNDSVKTDSEQQSNLFQASGYKTQGKVSSFPGTLHTQILKHSPNSIAEEKLRHFSVLPLVIVYNQNEISNIAGKLKTQFSLNDLKAIIAQTMQPPNHFSSRWIINSKEYWLILEQIEAKEKYQIALNVRPVLSTKGEELLELLQVFINSQKRAKEELYEFIQELQNIVFSS